MKKVSILLILLAFVFSFVTQGFAAAEDELPVLKQQVQELMSRIGQLEKEQVKQKEDAAKQKEEIIKKVESKVDLNNALSKLKIKGRAVAGFFDSGEAGSYRSGSFEVPDAKLQFSFQPDEINTVVMRFDLKNAAANSPLLDYFYLQSKDFIPALKDTAFSLNSRLGRFKLGFGEETLSDNAVEGILPSTSAGKVGASDEGVELNGKIKLENLNLKPLGWVVSISNGTSGIGSDTGTSKAFMGKLYQSPIDPLYLSLSYYDSGSLKAATSEMSIAGLASAPSTKGGSDWRRKIWEADVRYDFKKGKKPLEPPAYSDSKAIVRLSYGAFHDITTSAQERSGNFGFVDGIYNLTKKVYAAGRYSLVDLDSDIPATLNSVTAKKYARYSLGAGYRWSDNTILKLSYDWNKSSGPGVEDANDDLISAMVGLQF